MEGDPHSFDALHAFLDVQPYRLAYWRTSAEEINYRRFFDVNDLVGLRMETPEVFAETHCLIRELLAKKQVTGLRIDHCDGMFNPRQYLIRLQLLYLASQCAGPKPESETAANGIERSSTRPGARIRLERLARARSTWWSRRSWSRASICRGSGRCTAPPATTSSTSPTTSLSSATTEGVQHAV